MINILLSTRLGERRWTQADLARKTGIRPNTINALYNELTERINLNHLDQICEVLDCDILDILIRDKKHAKQVEKVKRLSIHALQESDSVLLFNDELRKQKQIAYSQGTPYFGR